MAPGISPAAQRTRWTSLAFDSLRATCVDHALDPVEELPPLGERRLDRGAHGALRLGGHGVADHRVIADASVVAIGNLVDVPERDLLARHPVVLLERARERAECAGNLPLGRERDR